ncbi:hypothetical protein SAMN05444148_0388 [Winogradskyella jejuensis]|uniref:Uncharacterized protein n=2 Tax=Winogradskyella jejuensis TaxID=1089305 RepID=A0A1M5KQG3_9FLAO|nr:hypothetical protein SAMN05444148_0388 [Winogradskyella jejuensis]
MAIITALPIVGDFKFCAMVYINFTNLDNETQQKLLSDSKEDVKRKFGNQLKRYAQENHINYDTLLEEEAMRNLYSYNFVFNI